MTGTSRRRIPIIIGILLNVSVLSFLIRGDIPSGGYREISTDFSANFSSDFDPINRRWLVIYEKNGRIYGTFVGLNGNFIVPPGEIQISGTECSPSSPCFDPFVKIGCTDSTCRFLLTYVRNLSVYYNILDLSGNPILPNPITLSSYPATFPVADFDYVNRRFFVVFSEWSPSTTADISGVLVDLNGGVVGSKVVVSNAFGDQVMPSVTFSDGLSYLVVWQDHRADRMGDIYYQFVLSDGTRLGENTAVGLFPGLPDVNPFVFWLPSLRRFVVFYKTLSMRPKAGDDQHCPVIVGDSMQEVLCLNGHFVFSYVDRGGRISYPVRVAISADISSATEHYARMGTSYVIFVGDAYQSLDRRRHIGILKFDPSLSYPYVSYIPSAPTFWFPNNYRIKVGLLPSEDSFCPPVRASGKGYMGYMEVIVVPPDYVLEEKKTKTALPVLFPRILEPGGQWTRSRTFVSATTYPGVTTAMIVFGNWESDKLNLAMVDIDPVMFDYDDYEQTELPVAVTNMCYFSYDVGGPCSGSYQMRVTGGKPPYTFQAVSGRMPPGVTLSSDGRISGLVSPEPISSICGDPGAYSCSLTFSVLVSDSSEPKKSSCMTFEIMVFPSPEMRLYHDDVTLCARTGESTFRTVSIWNSGTPVTVQILEPTMISFGAEATCSSVLVAPGCRAGGSSISPFYLEIYARQTTVGDGCFSQSCFCDCTKFKYELAPGDSVWGNLYFSSNIYGEFSTRITFLVVDSILGYQEVRKIEAKGISLAQDIFVTADDSITPSGCTEYARVCRNYELDLGDIMSEDVRYVNVYIGNAVTSSTELGCPDQIFLNVSTIYAPPNLNFRIVAPPVSERGTLENISIPNASTYQIIIQASGTVAGSLTFPVIIYSDDPDEDIVYLLLRSRVLAPTLYVQSIVNCGLALRAVPAKCYVGIENPSPLTAKVRNVQYVGDAFFPAQTSFEVPPLTTYMLEITFLSSATGMHFSIFAIHSNATTSIITFGLMGQVIDQTDVVRVEPPSLDFGTVITGAQIRGNVKFINMTMYRIYVEPEYIELPFNFPSASSEAIDYLKDKSFAIDFHPTSEGVFQSHARFRIWSERFSFGLNYSVSGTGVSPLSAGLTPSAEILPSYLDFGDVVLCSPNMCHLSERRSLTVLNRGNVPLMLVDLKMPSNVSQYIADLPVAITDFYQMDFVVHATDVGPQLGEIIFVFSSTIGSFSRGVTFYLNGVSPSIVVSPNVLSFPAIRVGEERVYSLSVTNTGDWKLSVTHAQVGSPFLLMDFGPFMVQPGGAGKIDVVFSPRSPGRYTELLVIFSDAPYSEVVTVHVFGEALEGSSGGLTASADVLPSYLDFGDVVLCSARVCYLSKKTVTILNRGNVPLNLTSIDKPTNVISYGRLPASITNLHNIEFAAYATHVGAQSGRISFSFSSTVVSFTKEVTFYLRGVSPSILVWPEKVSFRGVRVGGEEIYLLSVTNRGDWKLTITHVSVGSPFFSATPVPFEVQPNSTAKMAVAFRPNSPGRYTDHILIFSDAPYSEVVSVQATGEAFENPLPAVRISPESIDFGKVRVGTTKVESVTINSVGTSELFVSSISSESSEFILGLERRPPLVLRAGERFSFDVIFSPTEEKIFETFMMIRTNDPEKPQVRISLRGEGANPHIKVPLEVNFGGVRRGKTVRREFPIENTGNLPLEVEISMTGDEEFAMISEFGDRLTSTTRITVPEGGIVKLMIMFSPSGLEKCSATIILRSNDPVYSFLEIPVRGEGGLPVLNIDRTHVDFGKIYADESKEEEVNFGNLGNAPMEVTLYALDEIFDVSVTSFTVPPGEKYTVKFMFFPRGKYGDFETSIRVVTEDPKNPELSIVLKGRAMRFNLIPVGGGCSCSGSSGIPADLSYILFVLFFFYGRKIFRWFLIFFALSVAVEKSHAQEIRLNVNRVNPAHDVSDFLFVRSGEIKPKGVFSLGGYILYAKEPLAVKLIKGKNVLSRQTIVEDLFGAGAVFSYSFGRDLAFSSFIPIAVARGIESELGLSDPTLEIRYRIFEHKGFFSALLNPQLSVPISGESFTTSGALSPKLGIITSADMGVEGASLNTSANLGFEYRPTRTLGDIKVGPQIYLVLGSSVRLSNFSVSGEMLSFLSLEEIRKETTPVELILSAGIVLSEFKVRFGVGGGLTEGIGAPKYRLLFTITYDSVPPVPPISYRRVEGRVLDDAGQPVVKGTVFVRELGVSAQVEDGNFVMDLPEGRWSFKVVSAGHETSVRSFSIPSEKPEIIMRKLEPRVIITPTDRLGISVIADVDVKTQEGIFKASSDVAAVSAHGRVDIKTGDTSFSVFLSSEEMIWINLLREEKPPEQFVQVQEEKIEERKGKGGQVGRKKQPQTLARKEATGRVERREREMRTPHKEKAETSPPEMPGELARGGEKISGQTAGENRTTREGSLPPSTKADVRKDQDLSEKADVRVGEEPSGPAESLAVKRYELIERKIGDESKTTEADLKESSNLSDKAEARVKGRLSKPSKLTQEKHEPSERKPKDEGKTPDRGLMAETKDESEVPEQLARVHERRELRAEEKKEIEAELTRLVRRVYEGFSPNSWQIPESAYEDLDRLVEQILKNSDRISRIRIEGHTDITGTERWNVELSYMRANEVRRYLYKKGVKVPIEIVGYYYTKPIAPNDTEDRARNRRVEIVIFTKD